MELLRFLEILNNPTFHNISIISILHIITWIYCIKLKGFCIDDVAGLAQFSDRFIQEKDANGNVVKEYDVREYDVDLKDKDGKPYKVKIKNTQWNPHLPFPDNFMRWSRLIWGRSFREMGKDTKGHPHYGWIQNSGKHHLLNILVQSANLILGYNLLSHLFGHQLAFVSMLIFAVHPCGVQTVAWISGINYLFSLMGALLVFNTVLYVHNIYILLPLVSFFPLRVVSFFLPLLLLSSSFLLPWLAFPSSIDPYLLVFSVVHSNEINERVCVRACACVCACVRVCVRVM